MQFLYIFNSNFRPESALKRISDLVHEKALELSFHLVPLASWRTKENPRYKASKFANILNFVWALYGRRRFASNSRKKNCHNFSHTICFSHTIPIQNAFDHVTMFYNALCNHNSKFDLQLSKAYELNLQIISWSKSYLQ